MGSGPDDRPVPPSVNELAGVDEETAQEVVFAYVDECLRQNAARRFETFQTLPVGMKYVYSTIRLEEEVDNGGFNQYFFNIASDFALEALEGYRRFGAIEHARLLRRAIDIYHAERWFHFRIKLRRSLESFFDSYEYTGLTVVDTAFYELDEHPALLRGTYIRNHLDQCASG